VELDEAGIVRLSGMKGSSPIVSCYLDIDGRTHVRPADYQRELSHLLRRARARSDARSLDADFDRIEGFVAGEFDRSRVRGLAMFSAVQDDFWEVVEVPVPVRSHLAVNPAPAVRQLESIVQQHEPIAVLLVDKQRTRLFEFALGELVEQTEFVDELPRDYDERGQSERGSVAPHMDALLQQHARHAAQAAFELSKRSPFAHLIVAGSTTVVPMVTQSLHPYLSQRLTDLADLGVTAGDLGVNSGLDEVRKASLDVEARLERRREHDRVSELRDSVKAGGSAVAGLEATLATLAEHRVSRLLVSAGYRDSGWRCQACGRLAVIGRTCPACSASMDEVEDVVEEAVHEALVDGSEVEVCVDNADLDVLGRIGALLRY